MRYAQITERLQGLGEAKWEMNTLACTLQAQGTEVIDLTIGEPDTPTPASLLKLAKAGIDAGRLGYADGQGEPALRAALAAKYTKRSGRVIMPDQIVALPGTQTALFSVLLTLLGPGDEVIVGDPMYATYAGVIAATGAIAVPTTLRAERGFRLDTADVASQITPRTRVLFVNTPHNPTGAILRPEDITALGALAHQHDLWIVSDEVYEEIIFPGAVFYSPFDRADLAERVVVTSSISKSHAAPGFRSGWAVGSTEFAARLLPIAEAMLFGNQPFIADMTAAAVSSPSPIAPGMALQFARRSKLVHARLDGVMGMRVPLPEAGMFAVVDIRSLGISGTDFARALLIRSHVAVMPGESFGEALSGWLRLSLTIDDALIDEACTRIIDYAKTLQGISA